MYLPAIGATHCIDKFELFQQHNRRAKSKMLTGMVKEHMARQHLRREQQEKLKNEAIVAAHGLTEVLVDHLNHREPEYHYFRGVIDDIFWRPSVSHAYNQQKRLDVECKKLEAQSVALARHADAWVALVGEMNQALKEIGDVDNWARAIETDVALCAATLERAYRSGTSTEEDDDGCNSTPPSRS
uniref:Biogenesis of lysosome-related organelles complex 1 subunit 1 n=1 Tax=Globodera rostochiensis TaxID=31243 RepID=A0A914HL09_GLORO